MVFSLLDERKQQSQNHKKKKSTSEENPGDHLAHPHAKVRLPKLVELSKVIKIKLSRDLLCHAFSNSSLPLL